MRGWREELAAMGYRFQFITLAGWHALNLSMFELASAYRDEGMYGYSQLQQREFAQERAGYRAPAPGLRRHRLLRRRAERHHRRTVLDRSDGRQYRGRAVQGSAGGGPARAVA